MRPNTIEEEEKEMVAAKPYKFEMSDIEKRFHQGKLHLWTHMFIAFDDLQTAMAEKIT